jgi:hypothetical protein
MGLYWAMLNEGLPFRASERICDIYYPEDPEKAAVNLANSFGFDPGDRVDGIMEGNLASFYPSDKRIIIMTGGDVNIEVGISASKVLSSIQKGILNVPTSTLKNGKLRISLDLYRSHFFEQSAEAKLIIIVMALEALSPSKLKHPVALRMVDDWKRQLKEQLNHVKPNTDEELALKALERELLFRRKASLSSQIRSLVYDKISEAGIPNPEVMADRAVEVYDTRSRLVHDGIVSQEELNDAFIDAKKIVNMVLSSAMCIR